MTQTCRRGHVMDAANTYHAPSGVRQCRTCKRVTDAAAYLARQVRLALGTPGVDRSVCRRGHVKDGAARRFITDPRTGQVRRRCQRCAAITTRRHEDRRRAARRAARA